MDRRTMVTAAIALLWGCGSTADNSDNGTALQPVENKAAAVAPPAPGTPGALPEDRTPLEEPKGAIDPKSAEAAGQVMQSYGALLEQRRFAEAYKLWGGASNSTEQQFAGQFAKYPEIHAQVGKPGDMEGAAGSSYVTVPLVLYGRVQGGGEFTRSGTATLRRVNDVTGSTEAQRRWHIERIDLDRTGTST